MSRFKKGQRVVITGTVERFQFGGQHPDYVVVDLDARVGIAAPDGSGCSSAEVRVHPADLREMNPSELELRDPSDDHDPQGDR